jgi:hypothetical protein
MAFHAYKLDECFNLKHYLKIPKELFIHPLYKDKLSSDSILLYGFLLDRLSLSIVNRWTDKDNIVYLYFTRKELQELLGLSDKTIAKAFRELRECELVQEEKQKCSKPNIIYVGKIQELPNDYFKNRKNSASSTGNFTALEPENLRSNNTYINNTNIVNSNLLKRDNRFYDSSSQYKNLDRFYVI